MLIRTKWFSPASVFVVLIIACVMAGCKPKQEVVAEAPIVPTTPTELPMNYITTFQFARPERIVIEHFNKMSDQRDSVAAAKRIEITDSAQIDEFMTLTSPLADKGDMMVKMGDVPIVNVVLMYPTEKLYFTFYQNRVKTPDTSFYSDSPKNEKDLHGFLFSLLNK